MNSRVALLAGVLVVALASCAFAVSEAGQEPPRRDEFGVIPEDAVDKDLTLPDPILDRTWPGPRPGDSAIPPKHIAPDEDEIDPFVDDVAPAPDAAPAAEGRVPAPPARPLVGPDGRQDPGTPLPEADPHSAQIIEPELIEPSEIDEEDNRPSPLDRDDADYEREADDPGDW